MKHCPFTGKPCIKHKIFHITEVTNGNVASKSIDVCPDCISDYTKDGKHNIAKPTPADAMQAFMDIFNTIKNISDAKEPALAPQKQCPKCKSTLKDISKSTRLGCAECYNTFGDALRRIIQHTQHSLKHVGKVPKIYQISEEEKEECTKKLEKQAEEAKEKAKKFLSIEKRIQILRAEMKTAIDTEKYEKCSEIKTKLTDLQDRFERIKKIKQQLKRAIKKEDYEKADELKKKIEEIKKEE